MAKKGEPRSRLLHLMDILRKKTDENHGLNVNELVDMLSQELGFETVERKTIYADIAKLREYGFVIGKRKQQNGAVNYYHFDRDFDLSELRFLIDSLQSSKFIPENITNAVIKKIGLLCSEYEKEELFQRPAVSKWSKTENINVLSNVEIIRKAIKNRMQISFRYFFYDHKKQKKYENGGKRLTENPWDLLYAEDNYYLLVYNKDEPEPKHYRLDKMDEVREEDSPQEGDEYMNRLNKSTYTKTMFSMQPGKTQEVSIRFHNSVADVVIDRFGLDIEMRYVDEQHFRISEPIVISPQFLAWIAGFGGKAKIMSRTIAKDMKAFLEENLIPYS